MIKVRLPEGLIIPTLGTEITNIELKRDSGNIMLTGNVTGTDNSIQIYNVLEQIYGDNSEVPDQ